MHELFVSPSAPWFLGSVSGLCLVTWGLALHRPTDGSPGAFTQYGHATLLMLGQAIGGLLAILLLLGAWASGWRGPGAWLLSCCALAVWLYLGFVLPRQPLRRADKKRTQIRALLPGFVGAVRVGLAGGDAPIVILQRYATRGDRRSEPFRQVINAAIERMARERRRPFAALAAEARLVGCTELIDVADALAQAEKDGSSAETMLDRQATTIQTLRQDEWQQQLERRKLVLLGLVALSVVGGVLGNLLFVMLSDTLSQLP